MANVMLKQKALLAGLLGLVSASFSVFAQPGSAAVFIDPEVVRIAKGERGFWGGRKESAESAVVPALAQQESTLSSPQENDDLRVTWTDEEIEVAKEKVTEEDIEDADAKTEAAIRAFFVSDTNSSSGLGSYVPETGLAVVKASIKPPSVLAQRLQSVLDQVNTLVKMSSAGFWNTSTNFRSYYSSAIDWFTNFCGTTGKEWVPDSGSSFNFKAACAHHDFGYANYRKLNKWDKATKKDVDDIFFRDMSAHCDSRGRLDRTSCYKRALVYYGFVRAYSGGL